MKNTPYYFILFLFISSCFSPNSENIKTVKTESGCTSVDDCISKYDFEGARAYMAIKPDYEAIHDDDIKNVTIAESKYWADKGEIDKALTVIDESWGIDDSKWPEADWQSWRYNIIDKGVASFCEKSDFKQAKILALKAADDINVDGLKIGLGGTGRFIDKNGRETEAEYKYQGTPFEEVTAPAGATEIKAKGPSMRESLLKKINEYETLLK